MDNKNENIIEAVLEYAKRLAKFSDGKGDKMDDEK